MSESEQIYLTWENIHAYTKELAKTIKTNHSYIKGIVTVTRGGLVPVAILSNELSIKTIETLAIVSYSDDKICEEIKILSLPNNAMKDLGRDWIIVDELVDTGKTLAYIKNILPYAKFYSLITKIDNDNIDSYVVKYPVNSWIYFPWES